MYIHCPKGCIRRAGHLAWGARTIYGTPNRAANRIETPPTFSNAYMQMVAKAPGLGRPPALEFYDDLHGVGGLFLPEHWVIAVGVKDIATIADGLLVRHWPHIARIAHELGAAKGISVPDARELLIVAGIGRCIAHELGHALIYRGWVNPYSADEEAGADYYAGRVDGARRTDWRLGEMFFRAIGCHGPTCRHPSPDERSDAYLTGYQEQLQHAA